MIPSRGSSRHLIHHASVKSRIDVGQMKILAQGAPLPGLGWAAKRELPPELVKAIVKTMVELQKDPEGREMLKAPEVSGFTVASDQDFDPVRKAVKEAIGAQH